MVRRSGVLALASDARALTAAGVTDYRIDLAGWGAFLSFQHPIAGLTLAADVVRVPAGAVLTYDVSRNSLSCRRHTVWPDVLPAAAIDDRFIDDSATAFVEDVEAYRRHHRDGAVMLSGGYDSRLVLAAVVDSGASPIALVHDHGDEVFGLDARLALRVARAFGVHAERLRTARDFFSSAAYFDYLVASEVSTPSLYLFITQLANSLPDAVDAVWEGTFPGCLLFPVHQPPGGFTEYLAREAGDGEGGLWRAAACVFARGVIEDMRAAFNHALAEERSRYADDAHGVSEFVVRNRTRRRIALNAFQVYSNDVRPLTPGLTRAFWTRAASISYEVKKDHHLYRRLLRRRFPKAMRVPFMSGGALHLPDSPAWLRGTAPWLAARLNSPGVQRALWRLGIRSGDYYWQPSVFIDEAVAATSPSDPDLDRLAVSRLQRLSPPFDTMTDAARMLLFYRSMAQRVFSGTLSSMHVPGPAGSSWRLRANSDNGST